MAKIKPLARPGFTMFNNFVLDYMMPDLRPNAWKVLCFAIRKTIGWVDETTESGRKESDPISYSQFMEGTGIKSSATLSAAIQECLEKDYMLRVPSEGHSQSFDYKLNTDYELEIPDETTSESKAVVQKTSSESEEVAQKTTSDSKAVCPKTSLESEDTKERERKGKGNKALSPFSKVEVAT